MTLQSLATIATYPAIMTAWLVQKPDLVFAYTHVSHAAVGLVIALLGSFQVLVGHIMTGGPSIPFTRLKLGRWWSPSDYRLSRLREWHRVQGKIVWVMAAGQMLFGMY